MKLAVWSWNVPLNNCTRHSSPSRVGSPSEYELQITWKYNITLILHLSCIQNVQFDSFKQKEAVPNTHVNLRISAINWHLSCISHLQRLTQISYKSLQLCLRFRIDWISAFKFQLMTTILQICNMISLLSWTLISFKKDIEINDHLKFEPMKDPISLRNWSW